MAVRSATTETIGHIGALIMLMALSISVGGMIERSGLMSIVPAEMGSIWMALTIFMFMMVFIGMVMDPFGAVILVSATVAPIAYSNGIHPVHFWMIVITAFELGYLSPPVALNQLLARQVVGEAEMDKAAEDTKHKPFYYRYERWLLPVYTLFIGLLIVTYGGQALINNADNLKPVSHFLGLDQLRPAVLDQSPTPAVEPAPAAEPVADPAAGMDPAADTMLDPAAPAADDLLGGETAAAPAAPVAAPAGPSPAQLQVEVTEVVSNWAAAWSARDVEGYLSFYSANFELPGAQSRAQWESQRRARIASKASIEVDISNLNVQINGEEATAEFDQAYKADKYSDNVRKTLRLKKEDGRWKIVTEQAS
jgi:ketosteroid isomerase-like protein